MKQVAAVIIKKDGKYLIGKRRQDASSGGMWEFPGGKVEKGESAEQCAVRECQEELGVTVELEGVFMKYEYTYPDGPIQLTFFLGTSGETEENRVHSQLKWVLPEQLPNYQFCPANEMLIKKLAKEK